jgi:hypothetical protein
LLYIVDLYNNTNLGEVFFMKKLLSKITVSQVKEPVTFAEITGW